MRDVIMEIKLDVVLIVFQIQDLHVMAKWDNYHLVLQLVVMEFELPQKDVIMEISQAAVLIVSLIQDILVLELLDNLPCTITCGDGIRTSS